MPDIKELPKVTNLEVFTLGNKVTIRFTSLSPFTYKPDKKGVYYLAIGEAKQDSIPEFNR
jgi:hypothetical protein